MLTFWLTEQFAPFENTKINAVAVHSFPELCIPAKNFDIPPSSIIRKVPGKVTAEKNYPSQMLFSSHWQHNVGGDRPMKRVGAKRTPAAGSPCRTTCQTGPSREPSLFSIRWILNAFAPSSYCK